MNVRVFAGAKINLTLQVGRPRADGMHPLQSAIVFADVGDWVEAAPASALTLAIEGPFAAALGADDNNLVLRAARALAAAANIATPTAALTLTKALPIASGIGGGSSDAAATLKALNQLWRLGFSEAALMDVARGLGADVPVCVPARAAYMTGVGETTAPLQAPALSAVLCNPGKPLPTASVYHQFDALGLGGSFAERAAPVWEAQTHALADIAALGNDLEPAARALLPDIAEMTAFIRADARVRTAGLSGSGATIFALVDNPNIAAALADDVRRARNEWWVAATRLNAEP